MRVLKTFFKVGVVLGVGYVGYRAGRHLLSSSRLPRHSVGVADYHLSPHTYFSNPQIINQNRNYSPVSPYLLSQVISKNRANQGIDYNILERVALLNTFSNPAANTLANLFKDLYEDSMVQESFTDSRIDEEIRRYFEKLKANYLDRQYSLYSETSSRTRKVPIQEQRQVNRCVTNEGASGNKSVLKKCIPTTS
jgi:hypothetical protein